MNDKIENFLSLCDSFGSSNVLFATNSVEKILEAVATTAPIYELVSECMSDFDKEEEFDKAFSKTSGFRMPTEEYKVIALVFCILADIVNGKINFEQLIRDYFPSPDGKIEISTFTNKVIVPFKRLIGEAFNYYAPSVAEPQEEQEPSEPPQNEQPDLFALAWNTAVEMLNRLKEEKQNEQTVDVAKILQCLIITCRNKDLELLKGYVTSLKYACHSIRPLRHYQRALSDIVSREQI